MSNRDRKTDINNGGDDDDEGHVREETKTPRGAGRIQ
jgi:hypothetical protein